MSLTVSGTTMTRFLFGFSTVVGFNFVLSFTVAISLLVLNCIHLQKAKKNIFLYHLIHFRLWSYWKGKKLLSHYYFSPESRETSSHSCYFAFICILWTEGTWRGWDEKNLFLPALHHVSLHHAALQEQSCCFEEGQNSALFSSDTVAIQEEHPDWQGKTMTLLCRFPRAKTREGQLDEGPRCQQRIGAGLALTSGVEGALSIGTSGLAPMWVSIDPSPVQFYTNSIWSQHRHCWQWARKLWRRGRSFKQDCPNQGLKICCSHRSWVLYQVIPSEWCHHITSRLLNQECATLCCPSERSGYPAQYSARFWKRWTKGCLRTN